MQTVLLVIHVMLAAALIGVILIQRSEGGGLGMGRSDASLMTTRGTANLLTRTTAVLAVLFFATSIALAVLAGRGREARPIFTPPPGSSAPAAGQPAAPTPAAPSAPTPAPAAPSAPTAAPSAPATPAPSPAAPAAPAAPTAPTR